MATVNTVLGPVDVESLGKTLIHDHLEFGYPGFYGDLSLPGNSFEDKVEECCEYFNKLKDHGVKTYLDATTNDTGRDIHLMRIVSERTGINIIAITGYYLERDGASNYFNMKQKFGTPIVPAIYDMMMYEITTGIEQTDSKAGAIKVSTDYRGITKYEEAFVEASAKVQTETGTRIITHTDEGRGAVEQLEMLVSYGADPCKVMIGHMCDMLDLDVHRKLIEMGSYVGFDRFSVQIPATPSNEDRCKALAQLIKEGYGDRLMISSDFNIRTPGRLWPTSPMLAEMKAKWNVLSIFEYVVPKLKELGVTDADIDKLLIENPKHFFAG